MFVQVIKGKTSDEAALNAHGERWQSDVRPGATGYLGSTAGVAADGTFIVVARFDDEAAARANEGRPEQDAWFQGLVPLLDGEPKFRESSDTAELFGGGSNDAGFVQVMEGKVTDRAAADALETPELMEQLRAARPDLLGSLRIWFDGGEFVDVAYFTNEEAARAGETSEEFTGPGEDFAKVFGEMTFTDLRDPQLH